MLAIYGQAKVGGDPVPQDGCVPALQGDGQAAPLVAQHVLLLLAKAPASLLTTLTASSSLIKKRKCFFF